MRIIGGTHRGRRIQAPKNLPIRPTTDFAKEGLFNVLHHKIVIDGLNVLDLFGGSGNMSYEFASRGAIEVLAVDINAQCVRFINQAANSFSFKTVKAIKSDVFKFISKSTYQFDLIFADPPYKMDSFDELPDLILTSTLLKKDGLLIIEHPREVDFSNHASYEQMKTYGNVNFTFFQHRS